MDASAKNIEKIKRMFLILSKNRQKPLSHRLDMVASQFNLQKNSAKNYYYKSIKFLKDNPSIAQNLNINIDGFISKPFKKFNANEKKNLIKTVEENLKNGISIRKTCMMLAGNDAKQMLRLQNKYRNMTKILKRKKMEENVVDIEKSVFMESSAKKKQQNIINFASAKTKFGKGITDSDINALFMGLVRIVKKQAEQSANADLKEECKFATENFRQTLIDLNKTEALLKKEQQKNIELSAKLESQKKQICSLLKELSARKLSNLEKKSKLKSLKLKNDLSKLKDNNIIWNFLNIWYDIRIIMSNIFFGKTSIDATNGLIEKLRENYAKDPLSQHIFIVPDRISVLTEIQIFEALNIQSTCNIRVMTLSRLAAMILEDMSVISKTSSCMIFQKLLKQNRDNLKCFNKHIDANLATTLFETISQFKSCKIDFNDVAVKSQNKILQDKLADISLIYGAYQKYLKDKGLYDSMDRLDFLEVALKSNKDISQSFVYVAHFDSFTYQGYQIIGALIKNAKEFNIALTKTNNPANEHIYNEQFNTNILSLFESLNKDVNLVECNENCKGQFAHLQDNLFAYKPICKSVQHSNIKLFEGANFEEEVLFAASQIKDLIVNHNYKFEDIVVACADLKDKQSTLIQMFDSYDFNYYVDYSQTFEDSVLVRFLSSLVLCVEEGGTRQSLLSFIKNVLCGLPFNIIEDFENYVNRYNINNFYELKTSQTKTNKNYENFNLVRNFVLSILEQFNSKEIKTYKEYASLFEDVLINLDVSQKLMDLASTFAKEGNARQAKLFEQYYQSLQKIFDEVSQVLGEEDCDLKLFYTTLLSGVKASKVSTTPLSTNSMFVGDTSVSFFGKAKVYFILNASEKNFPHFVSDCGLISDKDIDALSDRYRLEPSIAQINFKERFKAFELLLKASDKLYLSYNYNRVEKSKILDDISKMFVFIGQDNKFAPLPFVRYSEVETLTKNNNFNTAKNNFVDSFRSALDGQKDSQVLASTLYQAIDTPQEALSNFNYKNQICLKSNVFFNKNTVSVSQVETFMTCPFLHFVRYGLNLKEVDEGELDALNVGKILHSVAQHFVQKNTLPIEDGVVKNISEKIFDRVIEEDAFESVTKNPKNIVLIKNLREEAVRFCSVLNYQAKFSSFKPTYFEARFDDNKKIKSIKIKAKNKILSLVGQVDRIDIFKDYFRIIDYKTGKCDRSFKELFFGKKVQLEAYIKVVENSLKIKPAGAYYLPVKSGFADDKTSIFKKYQLKGKTLNLDGVVLASDSRLVDQLTSDIVEIKYLKNDGDDKKMSASSKIETCDVIDCTSSYAIKLVEKACQDILQNNITPTPLVMGSDDPCKTCKYFALCRFDESFNNIKRNPKLKVDAQMFLNLCSTDKNTREGK